MSHSVSGRARSVITRCISSARSPTMLVHSSSAYPVARMNALSTPSFITCVQKRIRPLGSAERMRMQSLKGPYARSARS